jgi:SNF family Na+-dependent transporter
MYQYLYLIDILSSLNSTLNTINIFIFFLSLFVFFIYLIADNEEILKKCKKVLNKKVFIIWSISVLITCILPSKLTMYSYALESAYKESNNTELYQDVSKLIKKKILEETAKE